MRRAGNCGIRLADYLFGQGEVKDTGTSNGDPVAIVSTLASLMRRLPSVSVAICLASGLSLAASQAAVGRPVPAQTPTAGPASASTPPPIAAGTALILGRVVEAGGTTPIANAQVMLSGPALGQQTAIFTNGVAGGPRTVEADGQGRFLFRDLPAGTYGLDVSAAGFAPGRTAKRASSRFAGRSISIPPARRCGRREAERHDPVVEDWRNRRHGARRAR